MNGMLNVKLIIQLQQLQLQQQPHLLLLTQLHGIIKIHGATKINNNKTHGKTKIHGVTKINNNRTHGETKIHGEIKINNNKIHGKTKINHKLLHNKLHNNKLLHNKLHHNQLLPVMVEMEVLKISSKMKFTLTQSLLKKSILLWQN